MCFSFQLLSQDCYLRRLRSLQDLVHHSLSKRLRLNYTPSWTEPPPKLQRAVQQRRTYRILSLHQSPSEGNSDLKTQLQKTKTLLPLLAGQHRQRLWNPTRQSKNSLPNRRRLFKLLSAKIKRQTRCWPGWTVNFSSSSRRFIKNGLHWKTNWNNFVQSLCCNPQDSSNSGRLFLPRSFLWMFQPNYLS